MKRIPAWAWIAVAALGILAILMRSGGGTVTADSTGQPVQPARTGTGDKTAQNPKATPWHG